MKANVKNLHRDFVLRDVVGLLPPKMADTVLRFYENDRVNGATKQELKKVADFDMRKTCHMTLVEEKRPTRARPTVNEGLCYRQGMLKEKQRNKNTNNNRQRNKGKGKRAKNHTRRPGQGRPHRNGFKNRVNHVGTDGKSICNKCKKSGHLFRDCPSKRSESTPKK